MALAVGAATRRMHAHETALTYLPALAARGMIVDGLGQRFVNEDSYPGIVSHAAVAHRRPPFWVIVDETGYEDVPERERWGVRPTHAADDLDELGAELGMPAGALAATVAAYNRDASRGEDTWFHKDSRWLRPLEAPYAAIDVAAGFHPGDRDSAANGNGVAGFTLGGLATTLDGEVPGLVGRARAGPVRRGPIHVGDPRRRLHQRDVARRRDVLRSTRRSGGGGSVPQLTTQHPSETQEEP